MSRIENSGKVPEGPSGHHKKQVHKNMETIKKGHILAINLLEKIGPSLLKEGQLGARNKRGHAEAFDHEVQIQQKSDLGSVQMAPKKHKK